MPVSEASRRRWRRLVEIARTKRDTSAMAREADQDPDIKAQLLADEFAGPYCVRCSSAPTLLATPFMFMPCPRCLGERMRRLMARRDDLPWWVEWVALRAENDAEILEARSLPVLKVRFDDFLVCARCGKVITEAQARYWAPPGGGQCPPYCISCRKVVASGEERAG
jgi:hypothetical protein